LSASTKTQSSGQNSHNHDHFIKFQSISPPFAAGCSGLFRRGTTGKQRFSHPFWMYEAQTARQVVAALPVYSSMITGVS
jgi:hypothetical protein